MKNAICLFLAFAISTQTFAGSQTPGEVSPRQYYKPCADLLKTLTDGTFEVSLVGGIETPEQAAQLLIDYGLANPELFKKAILDQMYSEKIVSEDEAFTEAKISERRQQEILNNLNRFLTLDSEQAKARVWSTLEKVKSLLMARTGAERGHSDFVQLSRLFEALKGNERAKSVVEAVVTDLINIQTIALVQKVRNTKANGAYRGVLQFGFELAGFVGFDYLTLHLAGLLFDAHVDFLSFGGGVTTFLTFWAFASIEESWGQNRNKDNPLVTSMVKGIVDLLKRATRGKSKATAAVEKEIAEAKANMALAGKLVKMPSTDSALSVTIGEACNRRNLCDLTYNQIAYAGQIDLLAINRLNFRHQLILASSRIAEDVSLIKNLMTSLNEQVEKMKDSFSNLQQRPFKITAAEVGEEALNKQELLLTATKASLSTIEKINFDNKALSAFLKRAGQLAKQLAVLASTPTKESEIKNQAEEVILMLDQYNLSQTESLEESTPTPQMGRN